MQGYDLVFRICRILGGGELAPDEEKFYSEGAKEVEEEIKK